MSSADSTPASNQPVSPRSFHASGTAEVTTTTGGTSQTADIQIAAGVSPFVSPQVAREWESLKKGSAGRLLDYTFNEQAQRSKVELIREERETIVMRYHFELQNRIRRGEERYRLTGLAFAFVGWIGTICFSYLLLAYGWPGILAGSVLGGGYTVAIISMFLKSQKSESELVAEQAPEETEEEGEELTDEQFEALVHTERQRRQQRTQPAPTTKED